ncbi:MAG TPA: class I SAM-dependent methyltransferase [Candidatus Cloacimonadota bacterium]|nr:class I SAM-dependent methyltransferase [Candidatus Cloacimonadota bacterium]HOV16217.1 class I SAM-dependent methyltransferase [Candidatus Cloacimonadota bacterium]HQL14884.1 class I SAM-dependent methyltransferase [Candidatus Cloacimonadota bacterium]
MLQHEMNEQLNPINAWLHGRRFKYVRNWLNLHYGHKQIKILEIGVGYGRLVEELTPYLYIDYTGVELIEELYQEAKRRLSNIPNCHLLNGSILDEEIIRQLNNNYDVIIALETCEHIPAQEVPKLLGILRYRLHCKYFISSVPIEIGPIILLKNFGSYLLHYGRYREYTVKDTIYAALGKIEKLSPHSGNSAYPSHKGFDWRFYRYLLHQDFRIKQTLHLPLTWLPMALSTNVMFIAEPRTEI